MFAAHHDHPEMARLLLEHGADVNATNTTTHVSTALMVAAASDADETVAVLLADPGIDVNARSALGWTALMYAADAKAYDSARLLVAHPGTDLQVQDPRGESALTLARGKKMARLLSGTIPPVP